MMDRGASPCWRPPKALGVPHHPALLKTVRLSEADMQVTCPNPLSAVRSVLKRTFETSSSAPFQLCIGMIHILEAGGMCGG